LVYQRDTFLILLGVEKAAKALPKPGLEVILLWDSYGALGCQDLENR
jgi:hypothetical protein